MIPITADQRLTVPIKDGSASLRLRYLTGEQMDRFVALQTRQVTAAGGDVANGLAGLREMVDIFVVGWDGQGWPAFPADGKPGSLFRLGDLTQLSELISENIQELTGISASEAKNLQRRPSPSGTGRRRTAGDASDAHAGESAGADNVDTAADAG